MVSALEMTPRIIYFYLKILHFFRFGGQTNFHTISFTNNNKNNIKDDSQVEKLEE